MPHRVPAADETGVVWLEPDGTAWLRIEGGGKVKVPAGAFFLAPLSGVDHFLKVKEGKLTYFSLGPNDRTATVVTYGKDGGLIVHSLPLPDRNRKQPKTPTPEERAVGDIFFGDDGTVFRKTTGDRLEELTPGTEFIAEGAGGKQVHFVIGDKQITEYPLDSSGQPITLIWTEQTIIAAG